MLLVAQHPDWLQFPSSTIVTALEEQGSYMWVGTRTGVYRIHRETGTSTIYNNANSPLADNFITSLAAEGDSVMWIGSLNGGLMRYDGDDWSNYDTTNTPLPSNNISTLDTDEHGNLYVGSGMISYEALGLVFKFDGTNWIPYEDSFYPLEIHVQDTNVIWVRRGEEPPTLVKFEGQQITEEYNPSEWTDCMCFNAFTIDSQGNKWLASDNLTKFNDTIFESFETEIPGSYITGVAVDNDNVPWIALHDGIARFDSAGSWTSFNIPDSTTDYLIQQLEIDSENNKWVGTAGNGLYKYDTVWNSLIQGLPFDYTSDLALEENGNVWAATSDGLARYDGIAWVLYDTSNSLLPDNMVTSVAIEDGHIIWAGTWTGGAVRIEAEEWQVFNTELSDISSNYIFDIAVDSAGDVWMGHGDDPGLTLYDGNQWTTYTSQNSGLPYDNVVEIEVDQNNVKWIHARDDQGNTPEMLTQFDNTDWYVWTVPDTLDAFVGILSMAVDTGGIIWVSTTGWNGNFNGSDWTIIGTESPDYIYIDPTGTRWMNYFGGLARLDSAGWTVFRTTNSGIPDNMVNALAYDPEEGTLWIGTDAGVAAYNPAGFPVDAKNIRPIQEKLTIFPNPADGWFNVMLPVKEKVQSIKLFNTAGIEVKSMKPLNTMVYTDNLSAGVYFLMVSTEKHTYTGKVIIR